LRGRSLTSSSPSPCLPLLPLPPPLSLSTCRLPLAACSTTARRGALDWAPIFEAANKPVFEKLYASVRDGSETRRSLEFNGQPNYREAFAKETQEIDNQCVRSLRLNSGRKLTTFASSSPPPLPFPRPSSRRLHPPSCSLRNREIWLAGKTVRKLRPDYKGDA